MNLVQHERDTYNTMWSVQSYRDFSPGVEFLPMFLDMAKPAYGATILDAGTGSGRGAIALKQSGFSVTLCDLTREGLVPEAADLPFTETPLWEPLLHHVGVHDWVYCCDVLEHIPPTFTMLVISRLLEVAREGVFLSISLMPDQFGNWIGTSLHQSVQTFPQWRDQLNTVGRVVESRDMLGVGLFLVTEK